MKHRGSFLCLAVLLATLVLSSWVLAADYVPDEILVKYKTGARSAVAASSARQGMRVRKSIDAIRFHVVKLPKGLTVEKAIAQLEKDPNVEYVGPNHTLHVCEPEQRWPNDPVFYDGYDVWDMGILIQASQWGLYNDGYNAGYPGTYRADIHAPEAWHITTGSSSVVIADLDTGVDDTHPDLNCAGKVLPGYNTVDETTYTMDDNGHGTFTSGVAAACSDNWEGIAGVAWGCPILPVKVIGADGSGTEADGAEGVIWAVDHGAKILNMSFATDIDAPALEQAIDYTWDHGCLSVCSSGNEGVGTPYYPAAYTNALAVGATNEYDQRCTAADWMEGGSNYGPHLDVVAPGNNVTSSYDYYDPWSGELLDRFYMAMPGTSAAAPFVSGIAALIWSIHPDWTNAQVKNQIEQTADDLGDPGWDQYYGWGRVNAYRALTETVAPPLPPATNIGELRQRSVGAQAQLEGKVIVAGTGQLLNMAYIEEPDRTSGIMVYCPSGVPPSLALGDRVNVSGTLGQRNGEPVLENATITRVSYGTPLRPLGVSGRTASDRAHGILSGLLVRVWGKVSEVGADYLYLDDGSGLLDSLGVFTGMRINASWSATYQVGDKLATTGLLGFDTPSGAPTPVPVIRPRRPADMIKY